MVSVERETLLRFGWQSVDSNPSLADNAPDRLPHQDDLEGPGPVPATEDWSSPTTLRNLEVPNNAAPTRASRQQSFGDQAR
jgi:hypothetical protein